MEWLEITAASVDEAKEQALVHLGVDESDAEFEVLALEKLGLFGRLKQEARVRARVVPTPVRPKENRSRGQGGRRSTAKRSPTSQSNDPKAPKTATENRSQRAAPRSRRSSRRPAEGAPAKSEAKSVRKDETSEKEKQSKMEDSDRGPSLLEQADIAEDFVTGIAETLDLSVRFVRHDLENDIMRIEAVGEDLGLLVGRRGATAQAIDELVRTVLRRSGGSIREGKIRMDVGGIGARRAASLVAFVRGVAEQVMESGEAVALESMNRLDRKIVHDAVAEVEEVESRSEGEDPNRRVVIVPSTS